VRAGRTLDARLVLASATSGATRTVGAQLAVPTSFSGRLAVLTAQAGGSARSGRPPQTFADFVAWVQNRVRNDEVRLTLGRTGKTVKGGSSGVAVPPPPARPARRGSASGNASTVVGPLGAVVHGARSGLLLVR
jgi:hypothetical protein